jgi:hypothetical protein
MKTQALKKIIKEAVKEVIQEELKEILLEAIKSPKQTLIESTPTQPLPGSESSYQSKKEAYKNILGDMQNSFNTQNVPKPFNPIGTMPGSDLPDGEVGMDQIMNLMK